MMVSKNATTVSVIIATRNRADRLELALKSVAAQSCQNYEVIVVDDGSDPSTIEEYTRIWAQLDSRFILSSTAPGAPGTGPADARNRGIQRASGEFLAFLDDDDEWVASDHLEVGLNTLRTLDADFFFANMCGHRKDKIIRADWFQEAPFLLTFPLIPEPVSVYEVSHSHLVRTLRHLVIPLQVIIVRKELVQRFGGFLKHAWCYEDWNFAAHVADLSRKTLYRAKVTARYRFPEGDSVSLSLSDSNVHLQQLMCVQEARLRCQSRSIRSCARAAESWVYREMSRRSMETRSGRDAISLAWQGFCTYPTIGALALLARTITSKFNVTRKNG